MLVRTVGALDGVVFGGDHPGLVLLVECKGGRDRVGFEFDRDVPILALEVFRRVIDDELTVGTLTQDQAQVEGLSQQEMQALLSEFGASRETLRQMQGLLQDPVRNSAAIVQLLRKESSVFEDIFTRPEDEQQ